METTGELQFYSCMRGYYVYKDGGLQYKMKYSLANTKKEMHMTIDSISLENKYNIYDTTHFGNS